MTALRGAIWRHRPHAVLGAAVAGLLMAPAGSAAVAAACAVAAIAAASLTPAGAHVPRAAATVVAAQALLLGALAGGARLAAIDAPAGRAPPGAALRAEAVVLEAPRQGAFGASAVARLESGAATGLKVLLRLPRAQQPPAETSPDGLRVLERPAVEAAGDRQRGRPALAIGERVRIRGFVRRPRPPRDGFDFDSFLRSRGVLRQVEVSALARAGRRGGVMGVVDRLRERAEVALGANRDAALARGMVLGQDDAVEEAVREDFRRSGLAHLLAASGQNVMLLCALALPLLALAGLRHGARALALLALIAVYVPLAGAGASIVRAGVMGAAGIVAMLAGRPSSRLYALLLAALVTLAWNPRVSGDPGWQLSFAAVAGIALAAGPLRRAIEARLPTGGAREPATNAGTASGGGRGRLAASAGAGRGRLAGAAADGLAVTLAATAATAPLTAHHFGAVSVASLPANLLALPAVAPVMWVGMVQAALGQLGAAGIAAAGALAGAQDPLLAWIAGVARRLAEPAWAQPQVELGPLGATLALALVGAAALAVRRLRPPAPDARALGLPGLAIAAAAVAALTLWAAAPPPQPKGLRVDFLDVGQGDATLVRDGPAAVLFDGGPPEANVARRLRHLGVRRLSAVVATHQSRDHHGGLAEVLRRFEVGTLVDGGDGTTDPAYLEVLRTARERRVRTVPATAGLRLRAGRLDVKVLSPAAARTRPPGAGSDPNHRAVVALVESRSFRLLLTADAESPSLIPLDLPRVHALKVSHHGSADPGLPEVLARVRPAIAAIEVGAGNRYGHPAPSTLAALRRAVPRVYRTDRDGTISLELDGGRVLVRTRR